MENKKLILLVTLYKDDLFDLNKWIYYAKKIKKIDTGEFRVELVFATNNEKLVNEKTKILEQESRFIYVEPQIKKARTVIQAAKRIDGDWIKVLDPDDELILENIKEVLTHLDKVDLSIPLVEVGYRSFYEDGLIQAGNIQRGFNHHAPNYSNIYNLKKMKEVVEPKKYRFTVWDDFFLAINVSNTISIKKAPIIPCFLTDYFNNIGITNTIRNNKKTFRLILDECVDSYYSMIDFYNANNEVDIRNKFSFSQIKYANRLIVKSKVNIFKRVYYIYKMQKICKKKYNNIETPFATRVKFILRTLFRREI